MAVWPRGTRDFERAAAYYRDAAERGRADADELAEHAVSLPVEHVTSTGYRATPKENVCRAAVAADCRAAEFDALAHGLEQLYRTA